MYIIYIQGRKYISIQSMLHLHVHTQRGTHLGYWQTRGSSRHMVGLHSLPPLILGLGVFYLGVYMSLSNGSYECQCVTHCLLSAKVSNWENGLRWNLNNPGFLNDYSDQNPSASLWWTHDMIEINPCRHWDFNWSFCSIRQSHQLTSRGMIYLI